MYTQSSSSTLSNAAPAVAHGRRAFRDVTNANRNGGGKKKNAIVKRTAAVKKTSSSSSLSVPTRTTASAASKDRVQSCSGVFGSNNYAHDRNHRAPVIAPQPSGSDIQPDPNSYQMTGKTDNLDERDRDDPLCVTAYAQDIYDHFRERELFTSVRPVYMEYQPQINHRMRAILVDWLIEVHMKFKLVPETLYLTVALIDRFLEKQHVSRGRLQLVGVTCLLIASKYEDIYPPEIRDLVYICDRAYNRQDILEMEEIILNTLDYQVTIPSAYSFLARFLKAGHADRKVVQLSCYILDGTLQSYALLDYLPSQLAAAAVLIARRTVGRNAWSPTLLKYAVYCEEQILPVARAVLTERANASTDLLAVHKKYSNLRYGGVADMALDTDV